MSSLLFLENNGNGRKWKSDQTKEKEKIIPQYRKLTNIISCGNKDAW